MTSLGAFTIKRSTGNRHGGCYTVKQSRNLAATRKAQNAITRDNSIATG